MRDRRKKDPNAVIASTIATMEAIERNMKAVPRGTDEYRDLEDEWIAALHQYEEAEKQKQAALDRT